MIDLSLSLDEENFIADTSRDTEFARKLFGDLNRDILGPPDDSNVIILDDSDEEKKASDEKTAGTELVATSVVVNQRQLPPPLPMMPLRGRKMIIVQHMSHSVALVFATFAFTFPCSGFGSPRQQI
jgi:hypothetical protein